MPHLVQMDRRYGKKGLQVIAAHVQSATGEQILKKVKSLKMKFPVTKGLQGPSVGGKTIPELLIFNTSGKLVYCGLPTEATKVIRRELRGVTTDHTEGGSNRGGFRLPERPKDLSELRDWTNEDGKTIQAALVSVSADKAKLRLKNGKVVDYPIANLSEGDQAFIASKNEEE